MEIQIAIDSRIIYQGYEPQKGLWALFDISEIEPKLTSPNQSRLGVVDVNLSLILSFQPIRREHFTRSA